MFSRTPSFFFFFLTWKLPQGPLGTRDSIWFLFVPSRESNKPVCRERLRGYRFLSWGKKKTREIIQNWRERGPLETTVLHFHIRKRGCFRIFLRQWEVLNLFFSLFLLVKASSIDPQVKRVVRFSIFDVLTRIKDTWFVWLATNNKFWGSSLALNRPLKRVGREMWSKVNSLYVRQGALVC